MSDMHKRVETAFVYQHDMVNVPMLEARKVLQRLKTLEEWREWVIGIHPELDTQPPTINTGEAS